jgi:hypothetical protein
MAQSKREPDEDQDDNFFEALGTTASRYHYRDASEDDNDIDRQHSSDGRLTAIITLVLVVLVAIAMGILMLRGLDTIRSSVPATSNSSGSLEL